MIKKKTAVALINFFIGIIIICNSVYFFLDDNGIFEGTNVGVFIVVMTSLVAVLLCRFSLKKSI